MAGDHVHLVKCWRKMQELIPEPHDAVLALLGLAERVGNMVGGSDCEHDLDDRNQDLIDLGRVARSGGQQPDDVGESDRHHPECQIEKQYVSPCLCLVHGADG